MKLDRFIQILLPHDERFYAFLEESAQNLVAAAKLLAELARAEPAAREAIVQRMHELEHDGDAVAHKIFNELNATFVTPFDREDIHTLASALDDIMDYMDGAAQRTVLYRLEKYPAEMVALVDILLRSVLELQRGVSLLRDFRQKDELELVLEQVNKSENDADDIFERAIAALLVEEKDAIRIIKLKEVYVALETATDKCEDAANVMEALLIKHG
jgi:uncharacterized protein